MRHPNLPEDPSNPLLVEPRPLFLKKGRIAIVWSMKSACSHVVLWGFGCENLLPAARHYSAWPHDYRQDVYYAARGYARDRRNFAQNRFGHRSVLRFTRVPHKRVVSIFRHVCRHNFLWPEIQRQIGVDVKREGLSLVDFDRFLATQALVLPCPTNPHICAQWHPISRLPVDREITVNIDTHDLDAALRDIATELDLRVNENALKQAVGRVAHQHYAAHSTSAIDPRKLETHRFKPQDTDHFPSKDLAQTDLAHQIATVHHAADMDTVATGDTAGRLFRASQPA